MTLISAYLVGLREVVFVAEALFVLSIAVISASLRATKGRLGSKAVPRGLLSFFVKDVYPSWKILYSVNTYQAWERLTLY